MKQFTKVTAILIVVMLLLFSFAACKKEEASQTASPDKTEAAETTTGKSEETQEPEQTIDTVSIVMRSGEAQYDGSAFDLMVQEKFGIKFDLETIDYSDYAEKFKVMFSTMTVPDISVCFGVSQSELDEAGDRGMFIDFYQYMDIMPNLTSLLTELEDLLPYVTSGSGALYRTPVYYGVGSHMGTQGFAARVDLLDSVGFDYENMQDTDDVYKLFEALKAINPDNYVIGSRYELGNIAYLGESMGTTQEPAYWNVDTKEWEANYRSENAKDFIKFWSNAYNDGILHPDFLTQTTSDVWQLYYNGELTAYLDSMAYLDHVENNKAEPDMMTRQIALPPYKGKQYALNAFPGLNNGMMIVRSDVEVPEKIMKFIDWCFTEEGLLRTMHGEEDIDYVKISDDPIQWIALNEQYKDNIPEEYQDKLLTVEEVAARKIESPYFLYGFFAVRTPWDLYTRQNSPSKASLMQDAVQEYESKGLFRDANPKIILEGDELSEYNDTYSALLDYGKQIISQMITGQLDVDEYWDTFMTELDSLGYDHFIELCNKGTDNFYNVQPNWTP